MEVLLGIIVIREWKNERIGILSISIGMCGFSLLATYAMRLESTHPTSISRKHKQKSLP
jgi:hypothetical protein